MSNKHPHHPQDSVTFSGPPSAYSECLLNAFHVRSISFPNPLDRYGFALLLVAAAGAMTTSTPLVVVVLTRAITGAIVGFCALLVHTATTPGLTIGFAGFRLIHISLDVFFHVLLLHSLAFRSAAVDDDGSVIALYTGFIC